MKTVAHPRSPSSTKVNGAQRPSTTVNRLLGAFNPPLPLDGSLIVADVLRDQFNALNDDIQTRATEAQLSAEVVALESAITHCVPESEFDDAVNTLNDAVGMRVTQSELKVAAIDAGQAG